MRRRFDKEGGCQNNRSGGINEGIQFVENIFEELDSPGEWFLNSQTHTLYFHPPAGLDLKNALVETAGHSLKIEAFRDQKEMVVELVP